MTHTPLVPCCGFLMLPPRFSSFIPLLFLLLPPSIGPPVPPQLRLLSLRGAAARALRSPERSAELWGELTPKPLVTLSNLRGSARAGVGASYHEHTTNPILHQIISDFSKPKLGIEIKMFD